MRPIRDPFDEGIHERVSLRDRIGRVELAVNDDEADGRIAVVEVAKDRHKCLVDRVDERRRRVDGPRPAGVNLKPDPHIGFEVREELDGGGSHRRLERDPGDRHRLA
jgi:hypothetical protein